MPAGGVVEVPSAPLPGGSCSGFCWDGVEGFCPAGISGGAFGSLLSVAELPSPPERNESSLGAGVMSDDPSPC